MGKTEKQWDCFFQPKMAKVLGLAIEASSASTETCSSGVCPSRTQPLRTKGKLTNQVFFKNPVALTVVIVCSLLLGVLG